MADQTYDEAIVTQSCPKAPLNPRWIFKLGVIALVVFLVGMWGFWDASSVYPERGKRYAQWAQWQYLEQAKKAETEDFGIFIRETSVPEPREELARLSEPETLSRNQQDAANSSSGRNLRASMQMARKQWLDALKVVGMLDPAHTTVESPQRTLETLRTEWQARTTPKPLHTFDLIVQWMIMVVCLLIALIMVVHMLRVRAKRYSWDADSMKLTLPSGAAITPQDLEEVDKRKWDKFIVFLKIKPGHSDLGGQEVAVDTYQHQRVEDWILAMEEKAFGSQSDRDETDVAPGSNASPDADAGADTGLDADRDPGTPRDGAI